MSILFNLCFVLIFIEKKSNPNFKYRKDLKSILILGDLEFVKHFDGQLNLTIPSKNQGPNISTFLNCHTVHAHLCCSFKSPKKRQPE